MANVIELYNHQKEKLVETFNRAEYLPRFQDYLGGDKNKVDRFKHSLIQCYMNPSLIDCPPKSIIKAALDVAELDLSLTRSLGQAYIIAYKDKGKPIPQAQVGYKGWLALAERAGKHIKATPVFKCDDFTVGTDGYNTKFRLIPNFDAHHDGMPEWVDKNLRGVLIGIKNGEVMIKFVTMDKIQQLKRHSRTANSKFSPYQHWNLEMYQARAIKYVVSKEPMTQVIARAVEIDNQPHINANVIDISNDNECEALEALLQQS